MPRHRRRHDAGHVLVSLGKQGAVYDSVAVFMLGGDVGAAGRLPPGARRRAARGVYTYGGTVELPYIFELRRARLQCFELVFFGVACALTCRCNRVASRALRGAEYRAASV